MSSRPRRSSLKQKDASIDMLGLSRQEERMLQRAMYDSLRQKSQRGIVKSHLIKTRESIMTTRSKSLTKLLISVPEGNKQINIDNENLPSSMFTASTTATAATKPAVEEKVMLKRGTRYSPMRRLPLCEMLKSLEDKKNQFNNDRRSAISDKSVVPALIATRLVAPFRKRQSLLAKKDALTTKQTRLNNQGTLVRKPGRPKLHKKDGLDASKQLSISTRISNKIHVSPKLKRTPRTASLVARSSWMSQNSSPSSALRSPTKMSSSDEFPTVEKLKSKSTKPRDDKVLKPKKMIYHQKKMSQSQRISRVILATATQRFKKAKIKEKIEEKSHRIASKLKSQKINHESKCSAVIPPELWLDPRGQPVDTEDFINFLIYRDTPYLEKSLKWFALPPNKRKQRLYKIVPMENTPFNETIVYNERKEGGGREIIVQCQPPKMNDDSSELVSLDSEQTSLPDDSKTKCPASVISSCVTQAAVDEEPTTNDKVVSGDRCSNGSMTGNKPKANKVKSPLKPDVKSTHTMEIRKRKS